MVAAALAAKLYQRAPHAALLSKQPPNVAEEEAALSVASFWI
jgi:hypothetical protein